MTPLVLMLKSELLSFPDDVTQSVILKDFCQLDVNSDLNILENK